MIPKRPVKPLELVVSAVHCLREQQGWSVQKIIKYLGGKYDMHTDMLRPVVCEGIRRGLAIGILTYRSGLFRLNHEIIDSFKNKIDAEKLRNLKMKPKRRKKRGRKVCKHNCVIHKYIKKIKASKNHKKKVLKQIRKLREESKQQKKLEEKPKLKQENGN